jgi:protein-S-isoprenylcysteine O-methyltransferase Ste14
MAVEQAQRDHAGVRFPAPLIYLAGLIVGLGAEQVVGTPSLPRPAAIGAGVIGGLLAAALDGGAMRRFLRARTPMEPWKPASALVTAGPYRLTRNPMYLGMACLYTGLAMAFGLLWSLALLPVALVMVDRLVIAREERYLERRFGDSYREYRTQVRRWL